MPKKQFRYLQENATDRAAALLLYECPECKKSRYLETVFKLAPRARIPRRSPEKARPPLM